ncbi:MAG: DUF484 family protein [Xanthomonadales bacterium]|nr:DUF484 family protein [Xanthomonadales bacterium]
MSDITAEQVLAYLEQNPEFLAQNPGALDIIQIPHDTPGTSLIEHQVAVLQEQNRELKRKLQRYHEVALENESLLGRIHEVQLEMVQAESLGDLFDAVSDRLKREFDCGHLTLALFDAEGLPRHELLVGLASESDRRLFAEFSQQPEPAVGRLSKDRLKVLFGEGAEHIRSGAIAPLDPNVALGVLALGSGDEHRFHPGMGTLFLSLLAQTLGRCLAQRLPEVEQRRA